MTRRESHKIGDGKLIIKKNQSSLSFCLLQLIRRRVGK